MSKEKDFEIGLVLAGAVSAGAYTAGVMDFLLEALEAWNQAKEKNENVPRHNVKIKVISGASAGGMTAAIAAVEIRKKALGHGGGSKSSAFYKAWVDMVDIKSMLSCDDLKDGSDKTGKKEKKKTKKNGPILSILNSSVIEKIADEILRIEDGKWRSLPYVADNLKIYLSLSNLRGIPYKFDLAGETGFPYEMTSHADYQYVEICRDTKERDWEKLKHAAIATGAFPVGLSARIIRRSKLEYQQRLKNDGLHTSKLMEIGNDENFDFIAVDGGLLNNEPLELAKAALYSHEPDALDQENKNKEILKTISEQKIAGSSSAKQNLTGKAEALKEEKGKTIANAIIMVDPFPNINKETRKPEADDLGLFNVLGPIISAMRSQCQFKPEELLMSTSDDIYDRFLVAPIRHSKESKNKVEKNPLASGFFEGFGGFLFLNFRKHDYHLGRRNCQQFLKNYFALPVDYIKDNEIFKDKILDDYKFTPPDSKNKSGPANQSYPLIPLVGKLKDEEEPTMEWPTYAHSEFNTFKKLLAQRIMALLSKALPFTRFSNFLLVILAATLVGVGLIHTYHYSTHGTWFQQCSLIEYLTSFGIGMMEFALMAVAVIIILFLVAVHVIKVWMKSKVIDLIKDYLKDYDLKIQ